MKSLKPFVIAIVFLFSAQSQAWVSAYGVGAKLSVDTDQNFGMDATLMENLSTSVSSPLSFGYGASLDISFIPLLGLEVGLIMLQRTIVASISGDFVALRLIGYESTFSATSTLTFSTMDIPVLVRLNIGPIRLGVGGYFRKISSNINIASTVSFAGKSASYSNSFSPSQMGIKDSSIGGTVAAGVEFKLFASLGLFAEGRYNLALVQNSATNNWKETDIHLLLGLHI